MDKERSFEELMDSIQEWFMTLSSGIGPIVIALMPSLFTGHAIYGIFLEEGEAIAWIFSIVVAAGLELGALMIIHTAVLLSAKGKTFKTIVLSLISVAWCVMVALVIFNSTESFDDLVRFLGSAGPFLSAMVYLAISFYQAEQRQDELALTQSLGEIREREKQLEIEREERDRQAQLQHEKELKELELKHQEKLHKFDVKQDVKKVSKGVKIEDYLTLLQDEPDISVIDAARKLGVSRQTIYNWQAAKSSNGHGG